MSSRSVCDKTFYDILGVECSASQREIKAAYRSLALKYHPDRNRESPGEASQQFQNILCAYQTLSDETKREAYDAYGQNYASLQASSSSVANVFRKFSSMFTDEEAQKLKISRNIEPTVRDLHLGATHELSYKRTELCSLCDGSGSTSPSAAAKAKCMDCHGLGTYLKFEASRSYTATCHGCKGFQMRNHGPDACASCNGSGFQTATSTIQIPIPPGTKIGSALVFKGRGHMGAKKQVGDLVLRISHPSKLDFGDDPNCQFQLSSNNYHDVVAKISIPLWKALEETPELTFTFFDEPIRAKLRTRIPDWNGSQIVLPRRGFLQNGARGNICLLIKVEPPSSVRVPPELLEALKHAHAAPTQPAIPVAHTSLSE